MDLVKKFDEVTMEDVASVGGKNASLGEMIKNLSVRKINDAEKVIQLVIKATIEAGYTPGKDIFISLDSAASSFYENGKYMMGDKERTSEEMIEYYQMLVDKYPIISIEDGLAEDDWTGWQKLNAKMGKKITLIGDDIFVTNTKLLQKGIDLKAANSILIKPNQIGSLTSSIEAIKLAEDNKFSWVVSHRSGETLDTTIADIAYATSSFGLKTGSPHQSPACLEKEDVRRVKYQRVAYIERRDQFKKKKLPMGLIILDGWGLKDSEKGNAIKTAKTPNFDYLWNTFPHSELKAHGLDVGLPEGEMGNSEVGHLNIGAGRVVQQDVVRIDNSILDKSFFENKVLKNAFEYAKTNNSKIHILGLISNAVVHSSMNHLLALIDFAKKEEFKNIFIHTITDGRDSSPKSSKEWISKIDQKIKTVGIGRIASLCGRYYTMDRDNKWERTSVGYNLLKHGEGEYFSDWKTAIDNSYKNGITDEFIKPVIFNKNKEEVVIGDNDVVIFFDFRADRARQITKAFMEENFQEFNVSKIDGLKWVCFTEYDEKFNTNKNISVVFPKIKVENTLAEVLTKNGIKQLKIAETEKYAHVTYFFNGGKEAILKNETRILIDSPKEVATYDEKPEMSIKLVTDKLLETMSKQDFFVLNYANPDMLGHTGNFQATVEAVEAVDLHLGKIIEKAKELGYTLVIMADHGNAEEEDVVSMEYLTSHSTNPVPFIVADFYNKFPNISIREGGRLADVAVSILDLLEIDKPNDMTGESLIIRPKLKDSYFIKKIEASEAFDSRGKSTIRARIILDDGTIGEYALVPAGKSTGKGEAVVVSTEQALKNILDIEKVLVEKEINIFNQKGIDKILMNNLENWGGNTTLAVSLAVARIAALKMNLELYEYIENTYGYDEKKTEKVSFMMNIFNGGLHALRGEEKLGIDKPAIQEFMIFVKDNTYDLAIKKADNIYWKLKEILASEGYDNQNFGDEGGYSPRVINGIRVPNGFATTSEAFFYFLKEGKLDLKIKEILKGLKMSDMKELDKRSKKIRDLILKTKLPKLLQDDILKHFIELQKFYKDKNLSMAVRSSATAEDAADASFAGQHESYLNVVGFQELLKAIRLCFSSLFTSRAIAYRDNLKMDHASIGLSVGVQKMVRSDLACSGVMFSCDTESGFSDVVLINGSYGLGENIVKGRVETDEYYVYEKTLSKGFKPIIEKRMGKKEWTLVYGRNGKDIVNTKTDIKKQKQFVLNNEEILELARYSLIVENHYGRPMDMEWAKDGKDGKLYIVQARPETVQSRKDVKQLEEYLLIDKKGKKPLITGLSVGNKIGSGKAVVIKSVKDIDNFKKGQVLVTYMTDPDWVPIMKLASAIITESGSKTCFGGDTLLLTNLGFMTIADIVNKYQEQDIFVTSLNEKTLKVEWKKVLDGFKLKGNLNNISISQTGRSKNNCLKVTPDHKFLTFDNREIVSESIEQIIKNKKYILSTKEIPQFKYSNKEKQKYELSPDLGYFLGGMLTDGSLFLGKKSCSASFIQKDIPSKQNFINKMNDCLEKLYGETFHRRPSYIGGGIIRGKLMHGEASQFRCYKKKVVEDLVDKKKNICELVMKGDTEFLYNFMAGVIDGDGSYNKASGNRVNIYCSNDNLAQALTICCLKLGIEFQISNNRNIYNMQIVDKKIEKIFEYTQRVKGAFKRERFGMKLFGAKQLLLDILEKVNYKGRIRPYVLNNLLIDGDKIRNCIIPMIKGQTENHELTKIIDSSLKMLRVDLKQKVGRDDVYNIEVEGNHNYFVFTKYLTPIAVANCHAAIVGRELGIPTIVGVDKATKIIKGKQDITVVCSEGEIGNIYDGILKYEIKKTDITNLKKLPVKITMNIGDPNQAFLNSFIPNDGVGLTREEFIVASFIRIHPMALIEYKKQSGLIKKQIDEITNGYTDKKQFYIDKLAQGVGKIASAFYPKEIILRLSDFKTNEYKNLIGGNNYEIDEENPMIGFRGASRYYHPSFVEAFKLELEAIKKVIYEFGLDNVSLMVPFCRTVKEGEKVIKIIRESGLTTQKIYVMCEIPSNVILADKFLDIFDGMSIGSNDLTQLTLGIDRDANHLIQNISNENDEAVKELVRQVIKTCKARNKYIGICGQAPSDYPKFAQFLIDNHIDSMSLNPDSVLKIRKALE